VPASKPLEYEAFEDKEEPPDWRVEAIGEDGEVYVTIFTGEDQERRAREYAAVMNSLQSPPKN
jgi:hypothetical protein